MGIFNLFQGESIDIIEWVQIDSDTMVYHFPRYKNTIKYAAKLTVREGQSAVLFYEGKVADVFMPGSYELERAHLPILSQLQDWDHSSEKPFTVEIYFFNTTSFLSQKWGTKKPVLISDDEFGVVRLRAFGTYTMRIDNAEMFFRELTGTYGKFEISEISAQLTDTVVKSFPEVFVASKIGILELPIRYAELEKLVKQKNEQVFSQYGLILGDIYVDSIGLPENIQQAINSKSGLNIINDDLDNDIQIQVTKNMEQQPTDTNRLSINAVTDVKITDTVRTVKNTDGDGQSEIVNVNRHHISRSKPQIYYIMKIGERIGPMSIDDIYDLLKTEEIDAQTMVWRQGMPEWQSIENLTDIDLKKMPSAL